LQKWGSTVQVDGGVAYLYSYFQASNMDTFFQSNTKAFCATMIDVDHTTGTLSYGELPGGSTGGGGRYGYNSNSAIGHDADNGGPELIGGNMNGYDVQPEWGFNNEGFNFWGGTITSDPDHNANSDDAWMQGSAIPTATNVAHAATFVEYRIPVSAIISEVKAGVDYNSTASDKVKVGSLWKIGVRFAGYDGANWTDADKSGDGSNPTNSAYATYVYVPVLPGDANESGTVDFNDYLVVSGHFGKTIAASTNLDDPKGVQWAYGDLNLDGKVDFNDYLQISGNFGKKISGIGSTVPEPITLVLFGLGAFLLRRKSA